MSEGYDWQKFVNALIKGELTLPFPAGQGGEDLQKMFAHNVAMLTGVSPSEDGPPVLKRRTTGKSYPVPAFPDVAGPTDLASLIAPDAGPAASAREIPAGAMGTPPALEYGPPKLRRLSEDPMRAPQSLSELMQKAYERIQRSASGKSSADEMVRAAIEGTNAPMPQFHSILGALIQKPLGKHAGSWWGQLLTGLADSATRLGSIERFGVDPQKERESLMDQELRQRQARLGAALKSKELETEQMKNELSVYGDMGKIMQDKNQTEAYLTKAAGDLKIAVMKNDLDTAKTILSEWKNNGYISEIALDRYLSIIYSDLGPEEKAQLLDDLSRQRVGGLFMTQDAINQTFAEGEKSRHNIAMEGIAEQNAEANTMRARKYRPGGGGSTKQTKLSPNARKLLGYYNKLREQGFSRQGAYLETWRKVTEYLSKDLITQQDQTYLQSNMLGRPAPLEAAITEGVVPGIRQEPEEEDEQ